MSDQPRPVWLTREQRDALRVVFDNMIADSRRPLLDVIEAWDAAPADPTEAVRDIIREGWGRSFVEIEAAVLRALGMHDA